MRGPIKTENSADRQFVRRGLGPDTTGDRRTTQTGPIEAPTPLQKPDLPRLRSALSTACIAPANPSTT